MFIRYYRADNGRFSDDAFVKACIACNQTLDFYGVGAHFQNGIAESNVGFLHDNARAVLLNAIRHWHEIVFIELWPLTLLETT